MAGNAVPFFALISKTYLANSVIDLIELNNGLGSYLCKSIYAEKRRKLSPRRYLPGFVITAAVAAGWLYSLYDLF